MAHLKHKWKIVSKAASTRLPFYQAWGTPSMSQGLMKPHQRRPEPMLCERLGVLASHRPLIPNCLSRNWGRGHTGSQSRLEVTESSCRCVGTEGAGGAHLGSLCDGGTPGSSDRIMLVPMNCSWPCTYHQARVESNQS